MGIAAHSHTLAPSPPPFIHTSFLPPPAFGCLLATSRTLRTALVSSAAAWRKAAAHFGPAAAAKRAPLTDEELMEAAREATAPLTGREGAAGAAPYHRRAHNPPGGWAPHAPPPGGWTPATAARALYDARQAQPVPGSAAADQAAAARLRRRAAAGKAADAAGAYGWAADAAPAECASHRDAVARYNGVVGAYGADGARAARVWARLERALKARAPVVYDSLLPGWRAPPLPAAVDPAAVPSIAAAVAASAALHFGQATCGGEADRWADCGGVDVGRGGGGREGGGGGGEHWLAWELRVALGLSPPRGDNLNFFLKAARRTAAMFGGLAGAAAVNSFIQAGFLHPPFLPWGADLAGGSPPFERPDRSVWFLGLEGRGGRGPPVPALLDPARMRPLMSTSTDPFAALIDQSIDCATGLFLDLVTGGVWARAAAPGEMRDLKGVHVVGGLPQLPPIVLVRADGGLGLLGWLEELAGRMEAGLCVATPVFSLVDAWEGEVRGRGEVPPGAAAREACLSAFPGLPLAQDPGAAPSPAALAALARAWSHAGVGVALTGGVLQIVAGLLYLPARGVYGGTGCEPGERWDAPSHGWAYRVTMRLLQGDGGGGGRDTDVDATWPPTPRAPPGDGEFFPPLPDGFRGDLLRAVTLVGHRWVERDPHGRVTDVVDGPGVRGLTPRLLQGGREFSYTGWTRVLAARRGAGGCFDASILPGAQLGSREGAFLFKGQLVGGGVITFWARAPVLVLEVPRWRGL